MSKMMYKAMFEEELDRKQRALKALSQAIEESEYAKVTIKIIKDKKYLYGYSPKQHKNIYLGKYSKEMLKKYQDIVDEPLMLQKQIDEVNEDIPVIKKILSCL